MRPMMLQVKQTLLTALQRVKTSVVGGSDSPVADVWTEVDLVERMLNPWTDYFMGKIAGSKAKDRLWQRRFDQHYSTLIAPIPESMACDSRSSKAARSALSSASVTASTASSATSSTSDSLSCEDSPKVCLEALLPDTD